MVSRHFVRQSLASPDRLRHPYRTARAIRQQKTSRSVRNKTGPIHATHLRERDVQATIHCVSNTANPVDEIDIQIIELLQQNARRTFGDIGATIGLSAPAVKRRLDRLEEAGVGVGYTTKVDHAKFGRPLEAFIELRFAGNTPVDAIAGIANGIPEVQEIFTIAGDPDALVWVRVRDVADLKRLIDLLRKTGLVTGTKTLMVLGASKGQ